MIPVVGLKRASDALLYRAGRGVNDNDSRCGIETTSVTPSVMRRNKRERQ